MAAGIKAKLQSLQGALKEKVRIPKINPKEAFTNFGRSLKELSIEAVALPRWIIKGDGITRIAAIGFLASLFLFVITVPQVVLLLKKQKLTVDTTKAQLVNIASQPSPDSLKAVVFLGQIKSQGFILEAFAECHDESSAEALQNSLPEAQQAVQEVLNEMKLSKSLSDEQKKDLELKLRQVLN